MLSAVSSRVGSRVNFLYPSRGHRNVLRRINGEIIDKGTGPNGPFLTVQETTGQIRSLSTKKIVNNLR